MEIYVDGGYDNIRKQDGYGSFAAFNDDHSLIDLVRFELPEAKSNNEAEYLSLQKVLEWLDVNDLVKSVDSIIIFTDSRLMVNQLSGEWQVKAENLKPFVQSTQIPEKTWLKWTPRKNIVKILGH
jgi:ribonuclease HI